MKKILTHNIATFFQVGKIKPAPGTWGTLAGAPLAYSVCFLIPETSVKIIFWILLLLLGWFSTYHYCKDLTRVDPSEVVIDEVIGFGFATLFFTSEEPLFHWLVAFLLFRFFDIQKTWPIRIIDQWSHRKLSASSSLFVILDDVLAGFFTGGVLWILKTTFF